MAQHCDQRMCIGCCTIHLQSITSAAIAYSWTDTTCTAYIQDISDTVKAIHSCCFRSIKHHTQLYAHPSGASLAPSRHLCFPCKLAFVLDLHPCFLFLLPRTLLQGLQVESRPAKNQNHYLSLCSTKCHSQQWQNLWYPSTVPRYLSWLRWSWILQTRSQSMCCY